jgi:uncharacterized membrane protein
MNRGYAPRLRLAVIGLHSLLCVLMLLRADSLLTGIAFALLLLPLPGLVAGPLTTYGWASMLMAFYSAFWLAEWVMPDGRRPAVLLVALVTALDFMAMVLYARLARRERPPPGSPGQTAG